MYESHSRPAWRFNDFGLESPFSLEAAGGPVMAGRVNPWVAQMLALPGRLDDPARDRVLEVDGTVFDEFLRGEIPGAFAARWLAARPGLAAAAGKPQADFKSTDLAKAWFVIHDVGAGASLADERYTAARLRREEDEERRNAKNGVKGAHRNGYPVHGFVNRLGSYAALHDFAESRSGTVFEFATTRGRQICLGRTINIETVPDVETIVPPPAGSPPPPKDPAKYASIGHAILTVERKIGGKTKRVKAFQYFKWTHEAFDVLADLYILASARAGHLLTVCAHKEMDRNLAKSVIWNEYSAAEFRKGVGKDKRSLVRARDKYSDYHGDPYAFDMQAFYDVIAKKLNGLGGRQLPAKARFGVHPARLREPSRANIGNIDNQKNTFPWQSSPTIEIDRELKAKGWWNAAAGAKGEEEGFESADFYADTEAVAEDELTLEACASQFGENMDEGEDPSGEGQFGSFEADAACPHCANQRLAEEPLESWDQPEAEELDWLETEAVDESFKATWEPEEYAFEEPFANEADIGTEALSDFLDALDHGRVEGFDDPLEVSAGHAVWGQEEFEPEGEPGTLDMEEEVPEILGGTNSTTATVKLYHYGDLSGVTMFRSTAGYPRLTDYGDGTSQQHASENTGVGITPRLKYKYELVIEKGFFAKNFSNRGSKGVNSEFSSKNPIPIKFFTKIAVLTSSPSSGGSPTSGGTGGLPPKVGSGGPVSTTSARTRVTGSVALTVLGLNFGFNWIIGSLNEARMQQRLDAIGQYLMEIRQKQPNMGILLVFRFRRGADSGEGPTATGRFEGLTYLTALSEDDAMAQWRNQPQIDPGMHFEFKWIAAVTPVAVRPAGWVPAALAEFADLSKIEFKRMGFAQIGGFAMRGKEGPVNFSKYDFAKGYRFVVLQIPDTIPYYGPGGGLNKESVVVRQVSVAGGMVPAMIIDGEEIAAVVAANDDTNLLFHAKGAQARMMIRDLVSALRTVPNIREVRWLKVSQIRKIRDLRQLKPVPRTDAAR